MREFEKRFVDGLKVGLRPHYNNPRYNQLLVDCYNLKPNQIGLIPFEPLQEWMQYDRYAWPYIQIFFLAKYRILCEANVITFYDHNDNFLQRIVALPGNWWDVADFGDFFIMVNGNCVVMNLTDSPTLDVVYSDAFATIPGAKTICNFNGQVLLGNIRTDWHNMDYNSVLYSKIGVSDFNVGLDNEAGFRRINNHGQVQKLLKLGNNVIIYGDTYTSALYPYEQTFGLRELGGFGIPNIRAVDGDDEQHAFVDQHGRLWRIKADLSMQLLDYQEYINQMNLERVIVSYDHTLREFYITDPQCCNVFPLGECDEFPRCYLLNDYGLSEVHQIPTSVTNHLGISYGSFIDNGDWDWRFTTDTIDFNQRSLKTLQVVEFGGNYDHSVVNHRVSWSNEYNRHRNTFNDLNWQQLNPMGQITPTVTAQDFRISMIGNNYLESVINIDYLIMRYKFSDKRTIRGLYATE